MSGLVVDDREFERPRRYVWKMEDELDVDLGKFGTGCDGSGWAGTEVEPVRETVASCMLIADASVDISWVADLWAPPCSPARDPCDPGNPENLSSFRGVTFGRPSRTDDPPWLPDEMRSMSILADWSGIGAEGTGWMRGGVGG